MQEASQNRKGHPEELLAIIRKHLRHGDKKKVAEDLEVSRAAVSNVANGFATSEPIFNALFKVAKKRKAETDAKLKFLK